MTILKKIFRPLAILFAVFALSACEPPEVYDQSEPIPAGTVATYKISGHIYRAEVTQAKEGYVLWAYQWKKKPVFKQKTYRGILSVYNEEEDYKSWSKFDPAAVDSLFPLEVGRSVFLQGHYFSEGEVSDYPFSVTITVRGQTDMYIKDDEYPVFILDYTFVEDRPDGTRTYTKTAWYSEEMETAIRSDYRFSNNGFSMRIVALDEPEEELEDDLDTEGLGTIRL